MALDLNCKGIVAIPPHPRGENCYKVVLYCQVALLYYLNKYLLSQVNKFLILFPSLFIFIAPTKEHNNNWGKFSQTNHQIVGTGHTILNFNRMGIMHYLI